MAEGFHRFRDQRGVGLIETLVAVLVLAIGVLGVGAMLMTSLRNNQSSMERTQAVIQTSAMMDVMRANKAEAIIGRYNLSSWTCNAPAADNPVGASQNAWLGAVKAELGPQSCGRILCSSLACEVHVRWNDSRGASGNDQQVYTLRSRL